MIKHEGNTLCDRIRDQYNMVLFFFQSLDTGVTPIWGYFLNHLYATIPFLLNFFSLFFMIFYNLWKLKFSKQSLQNDPYQ